MTNNHDKPDGLIYNIHVNDKSHYKYTFQKQNDRFEFISQKEQRSEKWAELSHHQCPHCTLETQEYAYCPLASNLGGLLQDWNETISYTPVVLTVTTPQRSIRADTTADQALSSLIGLVMATSDCPHMQFFRPMAQFHLPLATSTETTFRAISTYLLSLYFAKEDGKEVNFDLSGLLKIYENIHDMNVHVKKRLDDAVKDDAALNAVTILDIFTITTTNFLEDELQKLKTLFSER